MFTDYSSLDSYIVQPKISLASIWVLDADDSYNVYKRELNPESPYWSELICIRTISGNGVITTFSGQSISVFSESFVLIRMRDIQRYRCIGGSWHFWWFSFITDEEDEFQRNDPYLAKMIEDEKKVVYECMGLLNEENIWSQRTACSLFSQLLFRWMASIGNPNSHPFNNENVIARAYSYMKVNADKGLKIENVANELGFSENQFRKLFQKKYHISPKRFLILHRINAAKALLNQTCLSISEISQRLGYSSQFHMSKDFKRVTGVSPREYRNKE